MEPSGMPIVQVSLLAGRSDQQKKKLLSSITEAVVNSVGGSPDSVRVIINEINPSHWSVAGIPFSERES